MSSQIPIPCVDENSENSDSSIDNKLPPSTTTSQSPPSNRIPSPFRDRNEVANDNRRMLVGPSVMALPSQSRLHISRQGVVQPLQSREGNESPSTKRSRVEEKEDAQSLLAHIRAISSNHDSSKPRNKKFEDDDALSQENKNHDDTQSNRGTTERNADRAESACACSDGDLTCQIPPIKRAKIEGTNNVDLSLFIRIPTPPPAQITASKEKPLTLTGTNHITQNNTANSFSTETANKKNNSSMALLQSFNAIANSSATESSPSLTSSASAPPPTATSSSENMNAAGNVVEKAEFHTQSENDKKKIALASKGTSQAPSQTLTAATTRKPIKTEKLTAKDDNSEGEVFENIEETKPKAGVNTSVNTIATEPVETAKKPKTPAMSIIKNCVVQQAVASSSAASFPTVQIKAAPTGVDSVSKNSISGSSTPAAPAIKKKKTGSGSKRKRAGSNGSSASRKSKGQTSGRWTQEEHQAFLEGLTECGREWKKVALRIPTRTSAQIRSHAQKYFAKLQRDQESLATNANAGFLHGDLSSPLTPVSAGLVFGVGGLSGTIITSPGSATIAPSVRRNVERIVSNPRAAQREVEDTMEALRERYRQLQHRLEERRRNHEERKISRKQKQQQKPLLLSNASLNTGASSEISAFASPPSIPRKPSKCSSPSRNRVQLPANHRKQDTKKIDASRRSSTSPTGDDGSSVCSNVSSIAASRTDLGNEEIIALQVLGDSLPRSESSNDIHVLGAEVFQGRGDSSIEVDGTMPSIHDNISSSSYDQLAPLVGVSNDNDSLINQGDSVTENENNASNGGDVATAGSLSVGGISTMEDPATVATTNATAT